MRVQRLIKNILGLSHTGSPFKGVGIVALQEKVYLSYQLRKDPPDCFHVALSDDGFSFEKQKKCAAITL